MWLALLGYGPIDSRRRSLDSDDKLIDQCARLCRHDDPLFTGYEVKRMCELAGEPLPDPLYLDRWYKMTYSMERLVREARQNRRRKRIHVVRK